MENLRYYRDQLAAKDAEIERLKAELDGRPTTRILLAQVKELQRELAEAREQIKYWQIMYGDQLIWRERED